MHLELDEQHREQFVEAVEAKDAAGVRTLLEAHAPLRDQIAAPWLSFDAPAIVHSAPDREMVDVLLEFGADVNAKSSWWAGGFTALHQVTGRTVGFDAEQAAYLIHRGAEVDAWAAAGLRMTDRLAEIVQAQPDVLNHPGPDGMGPLHFAATPAVADYLLDRGADPDARDANHNGTPLGWAAHFNASRAEAVLRPVTPQT